MIWLEVVLRLTGGNEARSHAVGTMRRRPSGCSWRYFAAGGEP